MRRLLPIFAAFIAMLLLVVSASASGKSPAPYDAPHVTVPCGATWVPYSIYGIPWVARSETLTMTLQTTGALDGVITFTAQTFHEGGFYWTQQSSACGACTLVLHDVQNGPGQSTQIAVDVRGGECPGPGVTVTGFQLQVGPASSPPASH